MPADYWYTGDQKKWLEGPAKNIHRSRIQYINKVLAGLDTTYAKILDVGCGDGVLTSVLHTICPSSYIVGVDTNLLRLDRAEKALPDVKFLKADARELPFEDNYFNIVLLHHVIEHIPEDEKVLNEICRVMAPGGTLILSVPNEGDVIGKLRDHVIQRKILKATDHVHFYDANNMTSLINKIEGLELLHVDVVGGSFIPHHGLHMLAMRSKLLFDVSESMAKAIPSFADSLFFIAKKRGTMFDVR